MTKRPDPELDRELPAPAGLSHSAVRRPALIERCADAAMRMYFQTARIALPDLSVPPGEPALVSPNSVSWRIFKNPIALFVGGVAAVILELAEPRVRTAIWEHSSFRSKPLERLQRTGRAALITVYGGRSTAEAMIRRIVRRHETIKGWTPAGQSYCANDGVLLSWVQATATFGFAAAYGRYVATLEGREIDRLFREARPAAYLYGAAAVPQSGAEFAELLHDMRSRLAPSPIVFEFLDIMHRAPILPLAIRPLQGMMVRGAVELMPSSLRERLGLDRSFRLRFWEEPLLRQTGALVDGLFLHSSPPVQACVRLGLPADYLFRAY